jgi:hypothetical protein
MKVSEVEDFTPTYNHWDPSRTCWTYEYERGKAWAGVFVSGYLKVLQRIQRFRQGTTKRVNGSKLTTLWEGARKEVGSRLLVKYNLNDFIQLE